MKNTHKISVGKPQGKGPLEGYTLRYEDNIKMYFRKMLGGWGLDLSDVG
jgi:hypothetical protein